MINIVIGSWGSYNACNKKALGSSWIALEDYESWEEIKEELIKQGFDLNGIDEELFIQDIEGIDTDCNWDYMHPQRLFEVLKESGVLDNSHKFETMEAYLECESFSAFEDLVNNSGTNWDDDIYLYKGYDWDDYGREYYEMCCYQVPSEIENFIDFDGYGRYIGDYYTQEYSNGLIEIRR